MSKQVNFRVEKETWNLLCALARNQNMTISAYLRNLIERAGAGDTPVTRYEIQPILREVLESLFGIEALIVYNFNPHKEKSIDQNAKNHLLDEFGSEAEERALKIVYSEDEY